MEEEALHSRKSQGRYCSGLAGSRHWVADEQAGQAGQAAAAAAAADAVAEGAEGAVASAGAPTLLAASRVALDKEC